MTLPLGNEVTLDTLQCLLPGGQKPLPLMGCHTQFTRQRLQVLAAQQAQHCFHLAPR